MAKKTDVATVSTSMMIEDVAENNNDLPKKKSKEIIQYFLALIENEVLRHNKVRLDRIGIIQVKDRAARKGRNPQTGQEIDIPASKKIAFRPSKSLKEQITGAKTKVKAKKA